MNVKYLHPSPWMMKWTWGAVDDCCLINPPWRANGVAGLCITKSIRNIKLRHQRFFCWCEMVSVVHVPMISVAQTSRELCSSMQYTGAFFLNPNLRWIWSRCGWVEQAANTALPYCVGMFSIHLECVSGHLANPRPSPIEAHIDLIHTPTIFLGSQGGKLEFLD